MQLVAEGLFLVWLVFRVSLVLIFVVREFVLLTTDMICHHTRSVSEQTRSVTRSVARKARRATKNVQRRAKRVDNATFETNPTHNYIFKARTQRKAIPRRGRRSASTERKELDSFVKASDS